MQLVFCEGPRENQNVINVHKNKLMEHVQGLTLRFQKHLPIGQVQVRFNLPECDVHLPKL
jgi:NOL1/NOP2/fmu family ribosome biogenesis protein